MSHWYFIWELKNQPTFKLLRHHHGQGRVSDFFLSKSLDEAWRFFSLWLQKVWGCKHYSNHKESYMKLWSKFFEIISFYILYGIVSNKAHQESLGMKQLQLYVESQNSSRPFILHTVFAISTFLSNYGKHVFGMVVDEYTYNNICHRMFCSGIWCGVYSCF